jgi:hypothetical protein
LHTFELFDCLRKRLQVEVCQFREKGFRMKMSLKFGLAALAALVGASSAFSEEVPDLSNCLTLHDDELRLNCYDGETGYVKPLVESETSSRWRYTRQSDDFSNKDTSFITLESDKAHLSITDAPTALFVRCDGDGGTEVFVATGGYIGSRNNRVPVRYKFGDNDPISERWNESTKGSAVFLPNGFRDFRSGLESGESFLFEVTDFRGSRASARFEGSKLEGEKISFVWNGCR